MRIQWMLAIVLIVGMQVLAADAPAGIVVDPAKKSVTIPAKVAPRKLAALTEIYPVEVIACWPTEKKGEKAHETVVVFDVKPSEVHKALESFGLKPGKPAMGEGDKAEGPEVMVFLELPDGKKVPIEKTLLDKKTGKPMPKLKWYFTGSVMTQPNPEKDEKVYGADMTGTLVGIFPVTNQVVIQTNLTMKDEPLLKLETDKKLLPPEGTAVKLIIEAK
ncbi:MAG TPA: YdjY domain-containing protein [Tepidisphaeraceae bacterium]|nr:YdjY domain-containing protein [Tepidisphaeraceae bacterium]